MRSNNSFKLALISGTAAVALLALPSGAVAQTDQGQDNAAPAATPTGADITANSQANDKAATPVEITVTGSRIKQDPNNSSLPLQIITTEDLQRNSISSPEQLVSFLTDNGTAADNLASNSDVTDASRRGNNGASYANLRGQGPGSTLILLNGRRVASHGLTGGAVDVNQIPFMAIQRVEVLKDGASAIYGTDALGGVINFITKKNYQGIGATAFSDTTQRGDAPILRASAIAGYGDLDNQGFNIMGTVGYTERGALQAKNRSFVNTFQNDRGLGVDTRGTPFGTILPLAGTAFPNSAAMPIIPGTTTPAYGGVNILHLPGQAGCDAVPNMGDYDTQVWDNPSYGLACTFDSGKNVYLQQPIKTWTYYGRATAKFGGNEAFLELTGSSAKSDKSFSQIQVTPSTSTRNYSYALVPGVNDAQYARVYNTLIDTFPGLAATVPYGTGFAYRWRCMECGERQINTTTNTFRAAFGIDGPLFADWNYNAGASYSQSKAHSETGNGYYYQDKLVAALNSGYVDPFLFPGETQSAEGLAQLDAAKAYGISLYSGKYTVKQADASVSGSLFPLPNGNVKMALGVDYRREQYKFTGDTRTDQSIIYTAPFDDGNALDGVHRDVKAAYAELLIPLIKGMELDAAGRIDDYTGFGTTTNPKISIKYRPWQPILFRASFNTAFRVPSFNQIFNAQFPSPYLGADFADPAKCPGGKIDTAAGCPAIGTFDVTSGGNPNLGPETANEYSAGVVIQPSRHLSFSADWWQIKRQNSIQTLALSYLIQNYDIFKDRFHYDANGNLLTVDDTYANEGTTNTAGIDFTVRGKWPVGSGDISVGLDGTWLLKKTEQVNPEAPVLDQLGVYSLSDDLGLRWKHNAFISWSNEKWGVSLTQIFRSGYKNQQLPGVANGSFDPCCDVVNVKAYIIYNVSAHVNVNQHFKLTAGIRNLLDTDPPFAISYDSNFGSGSSWEPRVADPRLRSFTVQAEVRF